MSNIESTFICKGDLKSTVKNRLLSSIENIEIGQKLVLLDRTTVKIVDATLGMNELLDCGVFLIENISIGRQPYPSMAAIYLVKPDRESIKTIIEDFTPPLSKLDSGRVGPMYKEAHFLFTTDVSSDLMDQLAKAPCAPLVKNFKELFIDFIPYESRVFNLGFDSSLFGKLFSPIDLSESVSSDPPFPIESTIDEIASKIASACVTMGENPKIRFQSSSSLVSKLSLKLQHQLDGLSSKLKSSSVSSKIGISGTILLLDRNIDLVSPLLHEFTVQAFCNDLLSSISQDGTRYQYDGGKDSNGIPIKKTVCLDSSDPIWERMRHLHVVDYGNNLSSDFKELISSNKAAQKSSGSSEGKVDEAANLSDLKDVMRDLPEFQEMKRKFDVHFKLLSDCHSIRDNKKIIQVAGVEQSMATGKDPEGQQLKDSWDILVPLFSISTLSDMDKARIIGIYLLTHPKALAENDMRSIFEKARLSSREVDFIRRLIALAGGNKYRQRQPVRSGKGGTRKYCIDVESKYDVSRFIPALKIIAEDICYDSLDSKEFPFLKPETCTQVPEKNNAPVSLRKRAGTSSSATSTTSNSKGPLFIYVLGGITYSEMRSMYELSSLLGREIYIGSDAILTPEKFLDHVRGIIL